MFSLSTSGLSWIRGEARLVSCKRHTWASGCVRCSHGASWMFQPCPETS